MRFSEAAQHAFSFLEEFGFRLTDDDATHLQYESGHVIVVINWDPRSGEIEVWIGLRPRTGGPQDRFSLSDILNMQGTDSRTRRMPYQVVHENRLTPFLESLAHDTRTYAQPGLIGDRIFFRRLETFRSAEAEADMREMKLRRVRSEAEEAWRSRDLIRLIGLYGAIQGDLSDSERARLVYAKKRVKS